MGNLKERLANLNEEETTELQRMTGERLIEHFIDFDSKEVKQDAFKIMLNSYIKNIKK